MGGPKPQGRRKDRIEGRIRIRIRGRIRIKVEVGTGLLGWLGVGLGLGSNSVVHGDLHLRNVLVHTSDHTPFLVDFEYYLSHITNVITLQRNVKTSNFLFED